MTPRFLIQVTRWILAPPTNTEHWNQRKKSKFGREGNKLSLDQSGVSVGHPGGDDQQAAGNTGLELKGVIRVRKRFGSKHVVLKEKYEEARGDLKIGEGMQS